MVDIEVCNYLDLRLFISTTAKGVRNDVNSFVNDIRIVMMLGYEILLAHSLSQLCCSSTSLLERGQLWQPHCELTI